MIALDWLCLVLRRHEGVVNEKTCVNFELLVGLGHREFYDGGHDGGLVEGCSLSRWTICIQKRCGTGHER